MVEEQKRKIPNLIHTSARDLSSSDLYFVSEVAFNVVKQVILEKRAKLTPEAVEVCVCNRGWAFTALKK